MTDVSEYLHKIVKAQRQASFNNSPQLTLGELIKQLEAVPDDKKGTEDEKTVSFDFEYAFPTRLDSWRGSYDELALGFDFVSYGLGDVNKDTEPPTLTKLLKELKVAIGGTYEGWKGGVFTMDENTPVWVSNPGNSGNTAVVGVKDLDWTVIIDCEY